MSLKNAKRILYLLFVSALIAFVASVSSPVTVKGETDYGYRMITEHFNDAITGDVKTYNFGYSDILFKDNKENGTLAKASMGLAAQTYSTAKEMTDFVEKQLGFSVLYQANYDRVATEFDCDFVAYTIAAKNVEYDGKPFTLYGIFIRGTAQNAEWYSNFDVGDGVDHRGFDVASEDIYTNLKKIISDRETSKIWITGHSRGASVGNLLAAKINGDEAVAYRKNVCAYNFACPATTTRPIAYNNIFNYDIAGDVVAGMPLSSWGFSRHGITFEFDTSLNDVAQAAFKEKTGIDYEGRDEIMEFSAAMEKWCPTRESYNEPKYGGLGSSPHELIKKVIPLLMGEEMKQLTLMDVGLNLNALSALLYFQQNQTSITHCHAPISYLCYIDAMYPHEHVYEYVSDNNATCTDDGTLTGTCYCGHVATGIADEGSAIGHSFLISVDDRGIITYTCEHCGVKIYGRDISYANASEIRSYEYLGEKIEPDVTLEFMGETLVEGVDYEKIYFDNDAPGTGRIVITGINKYTDTKTIYFTISEHKHVFGSYLSNSDASCGKDGTKTAVCAVCGEKDTVDDKGTALEHVYAEEERSDGVYFVCSLCGDTIVGRDLSYAEVSRIMDAEYLGEPLTCNPRVYFLKTLLKEGVDYELSYKDNDRVGVCTVTITGIGKYTGSITATFKITDHTHDFGVYVYNDDATCEKNGTETAVCVTCGETYTREVPSTALGHDYIEKNSQNLPSNPTSRLPTLRRRRLLRPNRLRARRRLRTRITAAGRTIPPIIPAKRNLP